MIKHPTHINVRSNVISSLHNFFPSYIKIIPVTNTKKISQKKKQLTLHVTAISPKVSIGQVPKNEKKKFKNTTTRPLFWLKIPGVHPHSATFARQIRERETPNSVRWVRLARYTNIVLLPIIIIKN